VALVTLIKKLAVTVWRYGVDLAFVSGANEQSALRVQHERPDIFRFGIEEDGLLSFGRNFVDFAIGRCADVEIVVRIECDGLRGKFGSFEYRGGFGGVVEAQDFCVGATGGVNAATRIGTQRPEVQQIGIGEGCELGRGDELAVAANGYASGGAFFEV
jgi:hypothetical protein